MNSVFAQQLIYARVEPDYSPQKRAGFQFVYQSQVLPAAELDYLEKRLRCFQPLQSETSRRQFFTLPGGLFVMAHTCLTPAHPEIIDRDRRSGAFIAHALVLNQDSFQNLGNNPCLVFDSYPFVMDPEEMVSAFGKATGGAPLAEINPSEMPQPGNWVGVEMRKLVSLAWQAEAILNKNQSLQLVGSEADIYQVLQAVFYLIPAERRPLLTFDTCIERCPTQPGTYWAVGTSQRQGIIDFIEVNAAHRRVINPAPELQATRDYYLPWLTQATKDTISPDIYVRANHIQRIARAYSNHSPLQKEQIDSQAAKEFYRVHEQQVFQDLQSQLSKLVGKSLAPVLLKYMFQVVPLPALLSSAISGQLNSGVLSQVSVQWILETRPELKDNEWDSLRDLARQTLNHHLLFQAAVLRKKIDQKARREALEKMSVETYQNALSQLMAPISPIEFVTPRHLSLLLADPKIQRISPETFTELVEVILESKSGKQLGPLAFMINRLDSDALGKIEKVLKKHPETDRQFIEMVAVRRKKLGPARKRFGLF